MRYGDAELIRLNYVLWPDRYVGQHTRIDIANEAVEEIGRLKARVKELEEELRQLREAVDRLATGEGLATMEVTLKDGSKIVGQGVRILPPPREGSG